MIVGVSAVVVLGAVMDAHVMQPALAHVLRGNGSDVAFVCYVTGVFAALMMARAGWLLRGAVGDSRLRGREGGMAAAIVTVWVVMAALIAAARWHAVSAVAASSSTGYDGGASTTTSGQVESAHLAAIVFLGIYVATGVLALVDFYTARNDIFQVKVNAYKRLAKARPALHEEEALLHRLAINLAIATHAFEAITGESALVKANQRALVERLKQHAVLRLATATRSDAVLGVASTRHPLNPAHQGGGEEG
ncbi:hypothetical protein ACQ856_28750 (plasmid) [Mycolicibacterium psychrotolerans]|uniref:hypothetical protein n=1 Tax=Mycolicibacterium psychrotolerans TaxID=216929 RepID=UPI003D676C40